MGLFFFAGRVQGEPVLGMNRVRWPYKWVIGGITPTSALLTTVFFRTHLAQLMVKRDLHGIVGQTETANRKSTSLIVFAQDMAMYGHCDARNRN